MKVLECFKFQNQSHHLLHIHPMVALVAFDMIVFIMANGYNPLITSMIRTPHENKKVGGKSSTHETGRAFDLRCKDWSRDFISEFTAYFTRKYKGHGAVSATDGQEKLIVIHGEGENIHIHVQLNNNYGDPVAWLKI
jgi:hypothetical protein